MNKHIFCGDDVNQIYLDVLKFITQYGICVSPRSLDTKEIHPVIIQLKNPRKRIIGIPERKINISFALIEWLWIMSGDLSKEILLHYNPKMKKYLNKEGEFDYSYGDRIFNWYGINQLEEVYSKLNLDKSSRQAICVIFDPKRDRGNLAAKQIPCLSTLQFLIRNNKLDLIAYMRSNDILLGFTYDIFWQTLLQEVLAGWLKIDLGHYYHMVSSMHFYESQRSFLEEICNSSYNPKDFYKKNKFLDYRLEKKQYQKNLSMLKDIEKTSRENFSEDILILERKINKLSKSWRSIAFIIIIENIYKSSKLKTKKKFNLIQKYIAQIECEFKEILIRKLESKLKGKE